MDHFGSPSIDAAVPVFPEPRSSRASLPLLARWWETESHSTRPAHLALCHRLHLMGMGDWAPFGRRLGRRISLELPTSQVWTNFTLSFPGKIGFQTHLQMLFIYQPLFSGSIAVNASFHSSFVCLIFVPRSIPETTSLIANVK